MKKLILTFIQISLLITTLPAFAESPWSVIEIAVPADVPHKEISHAIQSGSQLKLYFSSTTASSTPLVIYFKNDQDALQLETLLKRLQQDSTLGRTRGKKYQWSAPSSHIEFKSKGGSRTHEISAEKIEVIDLYENKFLNAKTGKSEKTSLQALVDQQSLSDSQWNLTAWFKTWLNGEGQYIQNRTPALDKAMVEASSGSKKTLPQPSESEEETPAKASSAQVQRAPH